MSLEAGQLTRRHRRSDDQLRGTNFPEPTRLMNDSIGANDRARAFYDRSARDYDRWLQAYERVMGIRTARRRLVSRAAGRTLEVGIGTGRNLGHYPRGVEVSAVDLSPAMLERARRRAEALDLAVDARVADARDLPFPDAVVDTVVATLALSAIPEHMKALAEMRRVLAPGGTLLVLDHARSHRRAVRRMQALAEPLGRFAGGWHLARDLLADIVSTGFVVRSTHRSRAGLLLELVATAV
jgi:ubiquinone/menaquinone biosynthesis C-methylase UbiE